MAQSTHTFNDNLNALFKEKYAKKIPALTPDAYKVYKMIEFAPKESLGGNQYHQPVVVAYSHGLTFASSTDDAFNLNAPVASQVKDAVIRGNPVVLRDLLGFQAISRAMASGEAAFMDATKYVVGNMLRSITQALEIEMLYGQMGLGTVASTSGSTITITTAEFAPGIWSGAENMPLEIRDSAGTTLRGYCNVTSTAIDARTVTVDSLPAGTTGTDVIWRKGSYGNEFAGIHKILANTGSLFGIDASTYSLWKSNSYSAGSASLSLAKIERALSLGVAKGLNSDVKVLVNPKTWDDLLVEQTALRKFDSSYDSNKMENGARELQFYGKQGMISIVSSIYVKEGYAYCIDPKDFIKIGSSDISFEMPGMKDQFMKPVENAHALELRCFADVALLCSAPGRQTLITGIVNTA